MSKATTYSCSYSLARESGEALAKGQAQAELAGEKLSVLPTLGEAIHLLLTDMTEVVPRDYRVELGLSSRERLSIFDLGYNFENFVSDLFRSRNEMILKYLLMNESVKKSSVWGDLTYDDGSGVQKQFEKCEVRLYETSVVLIPRNWEPIRVHYSNIQQVDAKDYAIVIETEQGEKLSVVRLGREFESTAREISDAMNALAVRTQALIKELVPHADPSAVRAASRLLKDGKAGKRRDIEAASPEVWAALEKKLERTPTFNGYQYLKSISQQENIAIGIKRGLKGDLTGNYIWAVIPISAQPRLGNAIALETARLPEDGSNDATAGEVQGREAEAPAGGNATYFFRIVDRKEYALVSDKTKEMDTKIDGIISTMNQMMLDVNFRREPIYLSDAISNAEPKYARYRYAAQKIPSLKILRRLFIGRVIHSSFDQWKADVSDLLSFNMSADDDAKWEKQ